MIKPYRIQSTTNFLEKKSLSITFPNSIPYLYVKVMDKLLVIFGNLDWRLYEEDTYCDKRERAKASRWRLV